MSNLDTQDFYTIHLDLIRKTENAQMYFNLSDSGTSDFYVKITKDGLLIDLTQCTVTMYVVKPNKNSEFINLEYNAEKQMYYCNLPDNFKNVRYQYKAQIAVYNPMTKETKITRSNFTYHIESDVKSEIEDSVNREEQENLLAELMSRLTSLEENGSNSAKLSKNIKITDTGNYFTSDNVEEALQEAGAQIKDMAKDVLLEDGKLYLKKSDGTKLGTGVILPVSGGGGSVTWENLTGKPSTFTPSSHSHSKSDITDFPKIPTKTSELNNDSGFLTSHQDLSNYVQKETGKGLSTNDLTTTLKQNYDNAYTHSQSTHAPANAQKNSDITKEEIEAKLTGEISSHTHPGGGSASESNWRLIKEITLTEDSDQIIINKDGSGNDFALTELMLICELVCTRSAQLIVKINNQFSISSINGMISNSTTYIIDKIKLYKSIGLIERLSVYNTLTQFEYGQDAYRNYRLCEANIQNINSISFEKYDINMYLSGSTIKVYGR